MTRINYIDDFVIKMLGKCVCFAGNAGSGKTTLASTLASHIRSNTEFDVDIKSFADVLRTVVIHEAEINLPLYKRNYDLVDNDCKNMILNKIKILCEKYNFKYDEDFISNSLNKCKHYNDIYRFCLQFIGTDLFRNQIDQNYWVNRLVDNLATDRLTIIDDGRFFNELEAVNNRGISVYIVKDINTLQEIFKGHESEDTSVIKLCKFIYINKTSNNDYNVNEWIGMSIDRLLRFLIEHCNMVT